MRMPKCSGWLVLASLVVGGESRSADWPQWRGPNRDGHSAETGLLKSIPAGGPKLLWTFDQAGLGYSGVAVAGGKLYSLGGDEQSEYAFAVDVATGRQLWRTPFGGKYEHERGDGPRSTPTVDGDAIYVLGANSDLARLDVTTGKVRWATNLKKDHGGQLMSGWGYSESPLVDGDQVVCSPGGQGGTLAAFDKETGQLRWRSTGLSAKAGYSSVVVSEAGGVRHYVQMTGDGVAGFSPKDGTVLWQQPDVAVNRTAVIPTPVVRGDHVFVTSGYGAGCGLIKLTADGRGGLKPEVVYKNRNMVNHHGGVVLVGDHLYGYSDDGRQWRCLEFQTGKVVWGSNKLEKGAIGYADGKLFCYGEQTGTLVVVDASPDGWRESGRFTLPKKTSRRRPRGGIWPHPVVADGKLFLRDQELLYCFDLRAARAGE